VGLAAAADCVKLTADDLRHATHRRGERATERMHISRMPGQAQVHHRALQVFAKTSLHLHTPHTEELMSKTCFGIFLKHLKSVVT
jgi:hypothetical protein